jgi:hypothetical protein
MGESMSRAKIQSSDVDLHDTQTLDMAINQDNPHEPLNLMQGVSLEDERVKALMKEEADLRAFMEEPITFRIAKGGKFDPDPVACGVNGVTKFFKRDQVYKEPRKFVESLLKTRNEVRTVNYTDREGVDQTKIEMDQVLVYPVMIMHDPSGSGPNERGGRWFQYQQANG